MNNHYDVIIIGSGPAGLTAATYASRAQLSVLILDNGVYGGQLNNTADIENYTGFDTVKGEELAEKMYQSSTQFGAEYTYGLVTSIEDNGEYKQVATDMDETYSGRAIVIATGATHEKIKKEGEQAYDGRGVSYCAVCDGAFFKNEHVVVIGGGDSAVEEGLYLTNLASRVTMISRHSSMTAAKIAQVRANNNQKIDFVPDTDVEEIVGDDEKVTGINLINKVTGEKTQMDASGVFIYVGVKPNTENFRNLDIFNQKGWVETNNQMETKIPGIYAVGDVRASSIRQIASAVGDGSEAGKRLVEYVDQIKETSIN
jgi:thioredoxin reductase (NADPH)